MNEKNSNLSDLERNFIEQAKKAGVHSHACEKLAQLALLSGHDVGEVLTVAIDRLSIQVGLEDEAGEPTEVKHITIDELKS